MEVLKFPFDSREWSLHSCTSIKVLSAAICHAVLPLASGTRLCVAAASEDVKEALFFLVVTRKKTLQFAIPASSAKPGHLESLCVALCWPQA